MKTRRVPYFLGMFVKRLRAILIDRALYKYCIMIIIIRVKNLPIGFEPGFS